MAGYDEFRIDALKQYKELPDETNELYKRYYMEIAMPSDEEMQAARGLKAADKVEALVASIEEKTKVKFDLVVSNSYVRNNSRLIKIIKMSELGGKLNDKIFRNSDNKLAAFVNANSRDAVVVTVDKNMSERLSVLFINDAHLIFQSFFEIKDGARLDLFEFYASLPGADSLVAPLQEFVVGTKGNLEYTLINDGSERSRMLNLSKGVLGEHAKANVNFVYNGSALTKTLGFFDTKGFGSSIEVTEAIYGTGEQRFDINTYVYNSSEKSHTRVETGAVLDGSSNCMLKGYAKVEKLTKGAWSRVNQRGIVLSEKAHIDSLPDMSIDYSNEVSATHSAATSPIDKEVLFYMNSRGIDESYARKMFVSSFISKYLSSIQNPTAREIASSIMLGRVENNAVGVINEITPRGVWYTAKN